MLLYLKVKRVKVIPPLARYILVDDTHIQTQLPVGGGLSSLPMAQGTPPSSSVRMWSENSKGEIGSQLSYCMFIMDPTQVSDVIAGLVEGPGVELKADNGKDDDGEEEQQCNVDQGTDGLGDGGHDHLQT